MFKWISCIIFLLVFILNCDTPPKRFTYTPKGKSVSKKQSKLKLAIIPFEDSRKADSTILRATALIPFVPWGTDTEDRPESDYFLFYPRDDIPETVKREFEVRGVFSEVKLSEKINPKDSDYMVRGKILSTQYKGRLFYYGFSPIRLFYTSILFFLGAPIMNAENNVRFYLEFVDIKTNRILFSKEYEKDFRIWFGFYYNLSNSGANYSYPQLVSELIPDFVDSSLGSIDAGEKKE